MNLNINRDDSHINDFILIFDSMGSRPHRVIIHDTFSGLEFEKILVDNPKKENSVTEFIPNDDDYLVNEKNLVKIEEDIWISYVVINKNSENYLINDVVFYFKNEEQRSKIDELFLKLSECLVDYKKDSFHKINALSVNNGSLELEPIFFNNENDTEALYNSSIIKKTDKLIKKIKKSDCGLSIFYGEKGTGKTNMSKYLASKIDRISIYIPMNMIEQSINNPEFRNFIKKYDKCLLIIDDCEFLYNPVYGKMNYFTNSILQLVDGFLSEHLGVQVLLIFNTDDIDDIDDNLTECNNILDVIEFGYLDSELASELSKNIGLNKKYKEDVLLNDVFKNRKKEERVDIGLK
jgi:hypothetical protein